MHLFDMNVPWNEETKDHVEKTLKTLESFGYGSVALTHSVSGKIPKTPCHIPKFHSGLKIFTRLNLILQDPQQNYGINSLNEVIKSYDLISVQPETEKMFNVACTSLDIDIISIDMTSRIPFPLKHGFVRQAVAKGIKFELLYSPVIRDGGNRRNVLANALIISRVTGGKNLILSSGTELPWQVRAPRDVINLAALYGIPSHLRKDCILTFAQECFNHAATRKLTYRSAVLVVDTGNDKSVEIQHEFIPFP